EHRDGRVPHGRIIVDHHHDPRANRLNNILAGIRHTTGPCTKGAHTTKRRKDIMFRYNPQSLQRWPDLGQSGIKKGRDETVPAPRDLARKAIAYPLQMP